MLPRKGTELDTGVAQPQKAAPRVLSTFEAAAELRRMGLEMTREKSAQLLSWYPDGVAEDQLQPVLDRLTVRAGLRVVAGGG